MSGEGIDMADRETTEMSSAGVDSVENKGEFLPREAKAPILDSGDSSETQIKESRPSHSVKEAQNNVCVNGDHELSKADDFTKPDDELRDKILRQVEFYFSDANIVKDVFLLKHVRSNKMGYVNMNLIGSFNKVKNLTHDLRVVAYSLRNSAELEVNDRGTKVRRIRPLPEHDEGTPFRTVVAMNLAQKSPTVATVAEEFSRCAGVTLIRIIRPGQPVPPDVNKYANKHPEIGTAVCAVIEFQTEEQAKKVCKTMSNTEDWRNGRRVVLLASQKNSHKKQDVKVENGGTEAEADTGKGTKKNKRRKKKTHAEENPVDKNSSSSNSGSEVDVAGSSRPKNPSGDSKSHYSSSHSSPGSSPHTQHRRNNSGKSYQPDRRDTSSQNHRHGHGAQNGHKMSPKTRDRNPGESSSSSHWVQRRRQFAQDGERPESGHSRDEGSSTTSPRNSRLLNMVGVLRQPKGPDSTRGFCGLGRGKPRCNTIG